MAEKKLNDDKTAVRRIILKRRISRADHMKEGPYQEHNMKEEGYQEQPIKTASQQIAFCEKRGRIDR
jgi:hypothetical protein